MNDQMRIDLKDLRNELKIHDRLTDSKGRSWYKWYGSTGVAVKLWHISGSIPFNTVESAIYATHMASLTTITQYRWERN